MNVWLRMLAVTLALGSIFAILRFVQTRKGLGRVASPELMRKGAHVAGGLVTMSFPWLFHETWPVVALSGISLASMLAMRYLPAARRTVGQVVCSVERRSYGDLCFPIGIALTWVLARHNPALFVIPIGFLALADAAAALIGKAYGTIRYRTTEGQKSLQGSLAFFAVGFLVSLAALLLFQNAPVPKILLIATLLGLLLMMCEAIAWRGFDNLVVPVLALALLKIYLGLDEEALLLRVIVLSALTIGALTFRWRTTLIGEGAVAAALFLYAAWALGGMEYLWSPLLLMVCLLTLPRPADVPHVPIHGVGPVFALCTPGLVCLILTHRHHDCSAAYAISFACATSVALLAQWHSRPRRFPRKTPFALAVFAGTIVGVAPFLAPELLREAVGISLAAAVSAAIAAAISYAPTLAKRFSRQRWGLRGVAIAITTVAATLLLSIAKLMPSAADEETPGALSQQLPAETPS